MEEFKITKVTADAIDSALAKRYKATEYAYIPQVRSATGYTAARTADAIIMGLWPSRGLELWGVEIKISRSDWLSELQDPAKAEEIVKYCDRYYLVVANKGIVQPGELPPTWGLMVFEVDKIKIVIEAPKLTPIPVDRQFLAGILRRAYEITTDERKIAEARNAGYEEGFKFGKQLNEDALNKLQNYITEFEAKSGIQINGWNRGRIAEAVNIVVNSRVNSTYDILIRKFQETKNVCMTHMKIADEAIEKLNKIISSETTITVSDEELES